MAGWSDELCGFMRVYPLPIQNPLHQRYIARLELERPSQDTRSESWRLCRERDDLGIQCYGQKQMEDVVHTLVQNASASIVELNAARRSLGVIKAEDIQLFFRSVSEVTEPNEQSLFDDVAQEFGEDAARQVPYLRFRDSAGPHQLQLREWGCYEWLRKQPDKASQLWDNLRLGRHDSDYYLLVGNTAVHRNVWLIINVFRAQKEADLFAGCSQASELPANLTV
jgi:hypothetical protein